MAIINFVGTTAPLALTFPPSSRPPSRCCRPLLGGRCQPRRQRHQGCDRAWRPWHSLRDCLQDSRGACRHAPRYCQRWRLQYCQERRPPPRRGTNTRRCWHSRCWPRRYGFEGAPEASEGRQKASALHKAGRLPWKRRRAVLQQLSGRRLGALRWRRSEVGQRDGSSGGRTGTPDVGEVGVIAEASILPPEGSTMVGSIVIGRDLLEQFGLIRTDE